VNRLEFLALLGASTGSSALAHAQDDVTDPANSANTQALRVLLGKGTAQKIDDASFLFDGRPYRGTFVEAPSGIVSIVPLEQYLFSVVSREMPHSWPAAALQTQAMVARTYVLQRSSPAHDYDLVPSEADQVYTGIDAERAQTNAAVDATAGMVLRFGSGFAQVMYSSCCGGHTEASSQAWNGPVLQYLSGVNCPYCTQSPWYKWTQNVDLAVVRSALAAQLQDLGDLQSVTLDPPDPSGRARFWNFTGTTGAQRIKAGDVRRALGTRTLPSLLVRRLTLSQQTQAARTLVIEGAGLGHGVGLCQWGARGMALTGADARQILNFYYPGTEIGNV
jgi:stage II sporulation protein D